MTIQKCVLSYTECITPGLLGRSYVIIDFVDWQYLPRDPKSNPVWQIIRQWPLFYCLIIVRFLIFIDILRF